VRRRRGVVVVGGFGFTVVAGRVIRGGGLFGVAPGAVVPGGCVLGGWVLGGLVRGGRMVPGISIEIDGRRGRGLVRGGGGSGLGFSSTTGGG